MTEREIRQLIKLLDKFRTTQEKDDGGNTVKRDSRLDHIIFQVRQWVSWYGRDEMNGNYILDSRAGTMYH